jgi:hypothetical protein
MIGAELEFVKIDGIEKQESQNSEKKEQDPNKMTS